MKRIRNSWVLAVSKFKHLSRKKKVFFIFLFLLFIVIIVSFVGSKTKKPSYKTEEAKRADISEIVTESGFISTNGKIDVYSPTTGIVDTVLVKNGDSVKENQTLFTVKSSATEQQKKAAYADYMTAKSTLESAQATLYSLQSSLFTYWNVYKTLAENDTYEKSEGVPNEEQRTLPGFQSVQKDWLAAEANYKNQQNVIAKAQAQTSSANLLYQATQNAVVKATIDGTISNLAVAPGSSVMVNTALTPTAPILSIGNFPTVEAVLQLSEDDIVKIKENQSADIRIDSIDSKTYKGIVRRVDSIGKEVNGVISYNVYIEITDPDELVRPGMSIDAEIVTNKVDQSLSVSNSAVKPYKGGKAVRVPADNKDGYDFIPVKVGVRGEEKTQILEGIAEGQEIITSLATEGKKKSNPFGF
jgi:RND family efflux transporter MFP subunit